MIAAWRDEFIERVLRVADDHRYSDEFLGVMVRELFGDARDSGLCFATTSEVGLLPDTQRRQTQTERYRDALELIAGDPYNPDYIAREALGDA